MSQIFLVAVIEQPTKKQKEEENAMPKLVLEPTAVIAKDDKDAALKVAMRSEALKGLDQNKLEVVVRPF